MTLSPKRISAARPRCYRQDAHRPVGQEFFGGEYPFVTPSDLRIRPLISAEPPSALSQTKRRPLCQSVHLSWCGYVYVYRSNDWQVCDRTRRVSHEPTDDTQSLRIEKLIRNSCITSSGTTST